MLGPKDYYLRRCSLELRYKIKKVIPHICWKSIFSNSWVLHETLTSIMVAVPADKVKHVQKNYGSKIQSLTGKSVKIVPGVADMRHIRQNWF